MAECGFCGEALRAGATFCAACGHAAAAPVGAAGTPAARRMLLERVPNPRAGWLIVAMPVAVFVGIFLFGLMVGSSGPQGDDLVFPLVAVGLCGALAWGVRRGNVLARWFAFAATLAWTIFMVWSVFAQIEMMQRGFADFPMARRTAVFGLVLSAVESALAVATLWWLAFPRGLPRRA